MPRQKMDPKHVRWFFHRRSLFVQIFTLLMDGVWWMVVRGFSPPFRQLQKLISLLIPSRLKVNERLQRQHSFVIGRTGAGKSVLLHHFIRHYLTRDSKPAIVLLDPHGDLANLVTRDRCWLASNRLVYIRFDQIGDRSIHFNPFDLTNHSEDYINRAQLQFSGAVERIVGETFTPRQRTLIRSCVSVMLHRPGSTLIDLVRFLQDGQNADLLRYGRENLPNPIDRQFFAGSFADPLYKPTKSALVSRLTDIVRDPVIRRVTCEPSSIKLGQLLDSGKVIVVQFDPSTQGRDTIRTIGQLFNAAILSHVLGRPQKHRYPIHMLVDECQYFISPTITEILGESRKFGLYLTLATQRIDALDANLQDAILGNVGNIWIGNSRHNSADKLTRETGIPSEKFRSLKNLHFLRVTAAQEPVHHRLRYIGKKYSMKPSEWRNLLLSQIGQFYSRPCHPNENKINSDTSNQKSTWEPDFI